jgi:hypothetical protein
MAPQGGARARIQERDYRAATRRQAKGWLRTGRHYATKEGVSCDCAYSLLGSPSVGESDIVKSGCAAKPRQRSIVGTRSFANSAVGERLDHHDADGKDIRALGPQVRTSGAM